MKLHMNVSWVTLFQSYTNGSALMHIGTIRGQKRKIADFTFKQHLLQNQWLEFDEASHECSSGDPLSKLYKWFRSIAHRGHEGPIRENL